MREKIKSYIAKWRSRGYSDDIPDEADPRLEAMVKAPSYRAICRAIIQNDVALVSLGFSREKTDVYMGLKRLEIESREKR